MASSTKAKASARSAVFNLPNQLTVSRLFLAIVLFALMAWREYLWGLAVFIVAASTDWLDGYFARKYGMVTALGRILDPFVDKVIICGAFIFLVADKDSQISAWMAVVVVGRELLVTALRSYLESQGADFSATMSGKIKMLLQCVTVGASLYYLSHAEPQEWEVLAVRAAAWAAVLLTVYSGAGYVRRAMALGVAG